MISEYILKKLADLAVEKVSSALKDSRSRATSSADNVQEAIIHHLRDVKNWSSEISFADLKGSKQTSHTFVPLEVSLQPRRLRLENERAVVLPLETAILRSSRHIAILGQPGAGKSTSLKRICQRLLEDETFCPNLNFPLVLRLRELAPGYGGGEDTVGGDVLFAAIQRTLNLDMQYGPVTVRDAAAGENASTLRTDALEQMKAVRRRAVVDALESFQVMLVLDGFDEIASTETQESLIEGVRYLANQLETSRILLTSRTGEFMFHVEGMEQLEINPLTATQISTFTSRWLGHDGGAKLLSQLKHSPYSDTTIRPLTIAHLCAIFERTGSVPDKPKTIYRKIVSLLLEKWDEQRSVKRVSSYARFDIDRKQEFLSQLAYSLTVSHRSTIFSRADLMSAYENIHDNFSLPREEALQVVQEIESHTGLLLQSGAEKFEFSHRSLQEFLAAEHIVRLPSIPIAPMVLQVIANELAIAVAISCRPSEYLIRILQDRLPLINPDNFIQGFTSRLLLERPDFEQNERTTAALLSLYSAYFRSSIKTKRLREETDENVVELERLLTGRLKDSSLLDGYRVRRELAEGGGPKIVCMTRRPGDACSLWANELPSSLWMSARLLDADGVQTRLEDPGTTSL